MLFMIDNYDSFTYNLVQYFGELGQKMMIRRNDETSVAEIRKAKPSAIVISPGPCTPNEAGISLEVIEKLHQDFPILGVCLGHQSIGQYFGGKVIRAKHVLHGKTSQIHHDGKTLFHQVEDPFEATRYHSLIIEKKSLPNCLEISAWTSRGEIMAVRHKKFLVEGVQFHPESILTLSGKKLLQNFLNRITNHRRKK